MTTYKNNFFFYGGQQPADHETGRSCARMPRLFLPVVAVVSDINRQENRG
jgi:hypothetical protein